ncbi:MAG: hypothetical protein HY207_11735 [Nitrospirae bacterium]|nr:hypothetical protein [Nitrospirota bacterium]
MMHNRRVRWGVAAMVACAAALASMGLGPARAADNPAPSANEKPRPGQYLGAPSCASSHCHGSAQPRTAYDVRQNEYLIWLKQDKHTKTYSVLSNALSKRIAKNMKLKRPPQEEARCLDCHGLAVAEELQARPVDLADGISCEGCHGPAGGWLAGHTEEGWTHQRSVEAGMTDLRDLVTRTEVCLGCHLGKTGTGVDHELLAAGHPDLVFELVNFSAAMPAHWTPVSRKKARADRPDRNTARAWAVGQVVQFRESMHLTARRAQSGRWPDFAEMECTSCHHALNGGKERQLRGYSLAAGLPGTSPARVAVFRHVLDTFSPDDRGPLLVSVDRLAASISRLFTPHETVAVQANVLGDETRGVLDRVGSTEIDDALTRVMLLRVAGDGVFLNRADLRSAKQVALAINALAGALAEHDPKWARPEVAKTIDALYDDVSGKGDYDPQRFVKHLAAFRRSVK